MSVYQYVLLQTSAILAFIFIALVVISISSEDDDDDGYL